MAHRTPNRARRPLMVAAVAASAALALAGCSGGLGSSDTEEDESGPIKLGMLAPFSGSESAFGDYMKNGAQLAIDEINDDGGVLDRQLELVTEDSACDATAAVAAANKLVTAGVVGSVGGYCSGSTLPTLPIFNDASIPMVIPAANSNQLVEEGLDNVFLINGTGAQQADATLTYALKEGATKVAVVNDNTDYSVDLADAFIEDAKADGTLEIVLDESVTPGEKDYAANVNNVIKSDPDFVVWTGYYQEGGLITRQLRTAGYDGTILVGDGSVDKQFSEIAGEGFTDNVVGTFTQTPDMLEGAEDWIADYKEAFNADPGPYSTQSYDAVRVMAEGIKEAGSTDGAEIDTALEGLDGFQIFSGPLTFADDHTLSSGGFVIVEVGDDGNFVLKDDLQG